MEVVHGEDHPTSEVSPGGVHVRRKHIAEHPLGGDREVHLQGTSHDPGAGGDVLESCLRTILLDDLTDLLDGALRLLQFDIEVAGGGLELREPGVVDLQIPLRLPHHGTGPLDVLLGSFDDLDLGDTGGLVLGVEDGSPGLAPRDLRHEGLEIPLGDGQGLLGGAELVLRIRRLALGVGPLLADLSVVLGRLPQLQLLHVGVGDFLRPRVEGYVSLPTPHGDDALLGRQAPLADRLLRGLRGDLRLRALEDLGVPAPLIDGTEDSGILRCKRSPVLDGARDVEGDRHHLREGATDLGRVEQSNQRLIVVVGGWQLLVQVDPTDLPESLGIDLEAPHREAQLLNQEFRRRPSLGGDPVDLTLLLEVVDQRRRELRNHAPKLPVCRELVHEPLEVLELGVRHSPHPSAGLVERRLRREGTCLRNQHLVLGRHGGHEGAELGSEVGDLVRDGTGKLLVQLRDLLGRSSRFLQAGDLASNFGDLVSLRHSQLLTQRFDLGHGRSVGGEPLSNRSGLRLQLRDVAPSDSSLARGPDHIIEGPRYLLTDVRLERLQGRVEVAHEVGVEGSDQPLHPSQVGVHLSHVAREERPPHGVVGVVEDLEEVEDPHRQGLSLARAGRVPITGHEATLLLQGEGDLRG